MSVKLAERVKIDAIDIPRFRLGAKRLLTSPPRLNPNRKMNESSDSFRFVELGYVMDRDKKIMGLTLLREYLDSNENIALTDSEALETIDNIDFIGECIEIATILQLRLDILLIPQGWPVSHSGDTNRLATLIRGVGKEKLDISREGFTGIQLYINTMRGVARKQYKPLNRAGTMFELLCSAEGNSSWFGDGDAFVLRQGSVHALVEWKFTSPNYPVQGESLYRYNSDRGRNLPLRSICSTFGIPLIYVAWGEAHENAKMDLYRVCDINDTSITDSRVVQFQQGEVISLITEWVS